MAVLPEIILQRSIINGMQGIRSDPRIINLLFKNLPEVQQEQIKQYMLTKIIDFNLNYPKTEVKVPAIILLLKTESESNQFLGDLMGVHPNYGMPDQDMAIDTLGGNGGATISPTAGLPALVLGNLHVLSQVNMVDTGVRPYSVVRFTEEDQEVLEAFFSENSSWPPLAIHVVSGAGAGQVKIIDSICSDRLDIEGIFEVNCNETSIIDIRLAEDKELAYGQPTRQYDVNNKTQRRIGANYEVQYQLEVLAGSQEEVIYLYCILKAILFAQRDFLEAQGVMALRISGTDLAPRSELLPDEVFTRSMTLQFSYPFDFILEQEAIKRIQITLTSGCCSTDPIRIDVADLEV